MNLFLIKSFTMDRTVSVLFVLCLINLSLSSSNNKRLVLHSDFDIGQAIEALRQENLALTATLNKLNVSMKAEIDQLNRTMKAESDQRFHVLKNESDKKLQAMEIEIRTLQQRYVGGSPYELDGGAASYICLPEHPTWGYYKDGIQDIGGYLSGGEYHMDEPFSSNAFGKNMYLEDAPCVVCESPRPRVIMIPGSTQCYPGWSVEYTGYLMTGQHTQTGGTDYVCLDVHPEAVLHGEASQLGKLFYFTEVKCGSLPCQEYPQGRELACTVCSK